MSPLPERLRLPIGSRQRGVTLVELMVVVALIASVTGMGVWTLSGSLRTQETATLARGILFAMMRARSDSVADGLQRRLSCTVAGCTLQTATTSGMGTPAAWAASNYTVASGPQAQVWAVDAATEVTTAAPAGPLGAAKTVTFFPDGTATAATVFVRDVRATQRYKVFVYSATGLARLVDSW